ncbi:MAG: hypothetical protein SFT94_12965 [Pseudanabaenaceae cyanobacterium bins.68]|nr:hypothetical protein [Pseudanabaenaceae cyanobacterium bins.68]
MTTYEWLELITDFSCQHCLAICAVLVPANLVITSQSLLMLGLGSADHLRVVASGSLIYAIALVGHVWLWWNLGVVMAPTFVLLGLALVCLGINLSAIAFGSRLQAAWFRSMVALLLF